MSKTRFESSNICLLYRYRWKHLYRTLASRKTNRPPPAGTSLLRSATEGPSSHSFCVMFTTFFVLGCTSSHNLFTFGRSPTVVKCCALVVFSFTANSQRTDELAVCRVPFETITFGESTRLGTGHTYDVTAHPRSLPQRETTLLAYRRQVR